MRVSMAGTIRHSSVNGPGVRYVLFLQGCAHGCPGCQNPETHRIGDGTWRETEDVIAEILATRYLDGITLSGGDPLYQPEAAGEIAEKAQAAGLDVWMYTGWTFEEILAGKAGEAAVEALRHVDVLVDGRFIQSLRSEECLWRGSTNQRLVDVKKSLAAGCYVPAEA